MLLNLSVPSSWPWQYPMTMDKAVIICPWSETTKSTWSGYIGNKKHSENAGTSMSVTFDLEMRPWPFIKCKKADVIRRRLLYCTLVPGMMSTDKFITLRDITICLLYLTFDLHLWPSAFAKVTYTLIIICILCCWMFVSKMKFVSLLEFEIWAFVWRKPKWRH